MLLRQERLAFVLLVVVAIGITLGSFILAGIDKGTLAKDFSSTVPEGSLVRVEGTIEELHWTESGGHLNTRIAGTQVFMPASVAQKVILRKGDRVLVFGLVQTYRGAKEVVVQSAADVRLVGIDDH
jgi:DNA/RNA endonuclease YhcR with UshA esterase domain